MKKILIIFLMVIVGLLTRGQEKTRQGTESVYDHPVKTIISGYCNTVVDGLIIQVSDYSKRVNYDFELDPKYQVPVRYNPEEKSGYFKLELLMTNPVYIKLVGSGLILSNYESSGAANLLSSTGALFNAFNGTTDQRVNPGGILIEPGDSLSVDLRSYGTAFENIKFSGKGAEKHHAMQDLIRHSWLYDNPHMQKHYSWRKNLSLQAKLAWADTASMTALNTVEIYKDKLSRTAYAIIKAYAATSYSRYFASILKEELGVNPGNHSIKKLFYQKLKESGFYADLSNPALGYGYTIFDKLVLAYLPVLEYYFNNGQMLTNYSIKDPFNLNYYRAVQNYTPEGIVKTRFLASYLVGTSASGNSGGDWKIGAQDFLEKTSLQSPFYKRVEGLVQAFETRLSSGAPAFNFSLSDIDGKTVKMSDFKGKVVLIDFMFTGCSGCGNMVPFLQKVEEQFKDRNDIVFLAVSIDKDIFKVKEGIDIYSVPGSIQLYTDGQGTAHPIIQHYQIRIYPSLVLVDKEGKLITANAPKPGLPVGNTENANELTEMIKTALDKSSGK